MNTNFIYLCEKCEEYIYGEVERITINFPDRECINCGELTDKVATLDGILNKVPNKEIVWAVVIKK